MTNKYKIIWILKNYLCEENVNETEIVKPNVKSIREDRKNNSKFDRGMILIWKTL